MVTIGLVGRGGCDSDSCPDPTGTRVTRRSRLRTTHRLVWMEPPMRGWMSRQWIDIDSCIVVLWIVINDRNLAIEKVDSKDHTN